MSGEQPVFLALGYRGDTANVTGLLHAGLEGRGTPYQVLGRCSRFEFMQAIGEQPGARRITGWEFDAGIRNSSWRHDLVDRNWPPYDFPGSAFVCSDLTREATGVEEADDTLRYGQRFAELLLPKQPKLILHFENIYRGDASIPGDKALEGDYQKGTLHVPRHIPDCGGGARPEHDAALTELAVAIFEGGMQLPPLGRYIDIVRPLRATP